MPDRKKLCFELSSNSIKNNNNKKDVTTSASISWLYIKYPRLSEKIERAILATDRLKRFKHSLKTRIPEKTLKIICRKTT